MARIASRAAHRAANIAGRLAVHGVAHSAAFMAAPRAWGWKLATALLLFAALAAAAGAALAQGRPRIEGVDVERVAELAPGTRLNFSVFGSPGGEVVLQIEGARHPLPLRELQPGVYDGSYRLEPGEQIAPNARVVAILRLAGQEARGVLDEPLLLDATAPTASQRGTATPAPSPRPPLASDPLPDSLPLPPGATPLPPVATPSPRVAMPAEPRPAWPASADLPPPGRNADLPPPARSADLPPTARSADLPPPERSAATPPCADCAIVESIRPLPVDDRPPATAPGALLGGLFGERVGQAVDRHVARVSGAVDRAVRGRPLDEPAGPGVEVVLRLPNGQRLVRLYDRAPDLRVGDSVRRGSDLGGARSERLLGAPSAPPPRRERQERQERHEQLAGSLPP